MPFIPLAPSTEPGTQQALGSDLGSMPTTAAAEKQSRADGSVPSRPRSLAAGSSIVIRSGRLRPWAEDSEAWLGFGWDALVS